MKNNKVMSVEVYITPHGDIKDYVVDTMEVKSELGNRVWAGDQYHEIEFVVTNRHVHKMDDNIVVLFMFVQNENQIRPAQEHEVFDGICREKIEDEVLHRIFAAA